MRFFRALISSVFFLLNLFAWGSIAWGQTGNSSTISGTVSDPSGAIVAGASVNIHNAVSGLDRTTSTDISGNFTFPNVSFNPYHMTVTASGFAPYSQDVEVRSGVPVS